jgi:hypothetical protein
MNTPSEFLGQLPSGLAGEQTPRMDFEELREALMLTSFAIGEVSHSVSSCPKSLPE